MLLLRAMRCCPIHWLYSQLNVRGYTAVMSYDLSMYDTKKYDVQEEWNVTKPNHQYHY